MGKELGIKRRLSVLGLWRKSVNGAEADEFVGPDQQA
jgi:hypothetical protein